MSILHWIFAPAAGDTLEETQANARAAGHVAADFAHRWRLAFDREPELVADLIRLGGVLTLPSVYFEQGKEIPMPIDPYQTERDQGRKILALQLLAAAGITNHEISQMMEASNVR